MDSLDPTYAIWVVAGVGLILFGLRWRGNRSKLPLPPGPKKLPLIGNLFNLPSTFHWETYMEWSRMYNTDILHLNLAGTSMIILSSLEATDTLLEKRSAVYSDRPTLTMLNLMGWDFHLGMFSLRTHRRLFSQGFNVAHVQQFQPKELAATHQLLRRLLQTPDDFRQHIKLRVIIQAVFIMSVAYGIEVLPMDDPYIGLAEEAMQTSSEASIPGRFLVDFIPVLRHVPDWFPGAGFKLKAKAWKKVAQSLNDVPFTVVEHQMVGVY
ncbi:cytochrome P450 [Mycena galericulata]|nr:cytochrome P450 [Mycena galericulata]